MTSRRSFRILLTSSNTRRRGGQHWAQIIINQVECSTCTRVSYSFGFMRRLFPRDEYQAQAEGWYTFGRTCANTCDANGIEAKLCQFLHTWQKRNGVALMVLIPTTQSSPHSAREPKLWVFKVVQNKQPRASQQHFFVALCFPWASSNAPSCLRCQALYG